MLMDADAIAGGFLLAKGDIRPQGELMVPSVFHGCIIPVNMAAHQCPILFSSGVAMLFMGQDIPVNLAAGHPMVVSGSRQAMPRGCLH